LAKAIAKSLDGAVGRWSLVEVRSLSFALVAGIVLLGLALRVAFLDSYSLWNDEVISIEAAQRGVQAIFNERFGVLGNQTVWYHLLLWASALPADPATTAFFVRLPEALAGAMVPLVVYGLGRELFGRPQGMVAALLAVLSPALIDRSQDARQYSMVVFLTVCMAYCLVRADRTGKSAWWWLFALAASANLLISYTSLVLVMPPFALYVIYLVVRAWRGRGELVRGYLLSIFTSVAVVLAVAMLSLLAVSHVSRSPIDVTQLSPALFYVVIVSAFGSFMHAGMDSRLENLFQPLLAVLACLGAYWGIRSGGQGRKGAYLCGAIALLPVLTLAVLSTGSVVFSRYALFCAPFYILLIAHGLVTAVEMANRMRGRPTGQVLRAGAVCLCATVAGVYLFGVYAFYTPGGHLEQSLRPDFRDAAAYLSATAHREDTIIVADRPMHGLQVMSYYWKRQAPADTFTMSDPTIFAHESKGDVYWVFWLLDGSPNAPSAPWRLLSTKEQGWAVAASFGDVVVMKEARPASMLSSMERMAGLFQATMPGSYMTYVLQGSVQQARGDIAGAAASYKMATTGAVVSVDESLNSADGFASIGMPDEALYWAVYAKFDKPYDSAPHSWLAQYLAEHGYDAQSKAELKMAEELEK